MTSDAPASLPAARERWLLAAIVVVALVARAWDLGSVSLNHYDEGVYAFTAWGLADPARPIHPEQKNSPIGLAWLASLGMRAVGPSDRAPLVVNVLVGTLSVVALWFVLRGWFGPRAGLAGATLLGCNEFHIAMSRSGMTDVLLAFLFLCGLPVAARALVSPIGRVTLQAALLTGAAWNTKYHGWLTTAVATAGVLPWTFAAGWTRRDYLRAAARLAIVTAIAIACYLPWFFVAAAQAGGFDKLAAYQWSFLDPNVGRNFLRQADNLRYFDGALADAAVPAALGVLALAAPSGASIALGALAVVAAVAGVAAGGMVQLWMLTAVAVPLLLSRFREMGAWLLLAWGASFLVLVPIYNPYVRTTLPLVVAFCAAGGVVLAWLADRAHRRAPAPPAALLLRVAPLVVAVLVVTLGLVRHDTARWRPSRDLPDAARHIRDIVGPGTRVIVIGEAALAFYLELEGVRAFRGFEYWETVVDERAPVYVATGIYIQRAPTLRKNYALLADRLTPLAEFPFFPYDSRLLESFAPANALALLAERRPDYTVHLYRYDPDPSGRVPVLAKY